MAQLDLTNIAATSITTPAAGVTSVFVDTDKRLKTKDSAGFVSNGADFNYFSTAAQTPAAATRTYITGSQVTVPVGKLQIGSMIRWSYNATKTAAGIAASTIDVAVGTAGTTADAAALSFAKPAGTAVVDESWNEVTMIVRGPLTASGILVGTYWMNHNLAATGHAVIPCVVVNAVSGSINLTTANLFVGLCITTGAADAITIQQVTTEVFNL